VAHLAPEVRRTGRYTPATDIYAAGMTLYRLVNGDKYLPFVPPPMIAALVAAGKYPRRSEYREFVPRPIRTLINKAISVDPRQRFSSAEEMRHALEQITINMNWDERVLADGTQWISGWNDHCYEVVRRRTRLGHWEITVRKGHSKQTLRRMERFCLTTADRKIAERHTRRVLQDFVLGRCR